MKENEQNSEPKNERTVQSPKVIPKAEIVMPAGFHPSIQNPKVMTAVEFKRENEMPPRKNIKEL